MKLNSKIVILGIAALLSIQVQAMQEQQPAVTKSSVLTNTAEMQKFYWELIMRAIAENNTAEVQDLLSKALKRGFDINAQDDNGYTLLHLGIFTDNSAIIELLLKAGANPNIKNKTEGLTSLHMQIG